MELYQLRTFVAVAEEGSLARAAERLSASQPAVSAQIRALEEEFGLKLFDRLPSGMTITPAGEALWESAEQVLKAASDLTALAAGMHRSLSGRLRLGFNRDGGALRASQLLGTISRDHPALTFEIVTSTSGVLVKRVLARELDAAFYEGSCDDEQVESLELMVQDLVIAIPQDWAEALDRPDWRLLAERPWVFVSPSCSYHRYIEQLERENGLRLQKRFQTDDDATGLNLIADRSGITMTTMEALRYSGLDKSGEVAIWPHFRDKLPLSLCHLKSRRSDPVIVALREAASALWAEAGVSESG
jgi:DNA-binding transcriptional LysR family regulator